MSIKTFFSKICSRYMLTQLSLMALTVVTLIVVVAVGTAVYTHHGEEIIVPDVKSKSFADAERMLTELGLDVVVSDTGYNRQLAPECVLQQIPLAGAKVKSGRIVYLTLNASSKPTLVIPDLIDNSSLREAIARLKVLGFKVGETQYVPGEKDWVYGIVCRGKSLAAGDRVPIDAMVVLQVGNGMLGEDADVTVTDAPEIIYEDDDEAEDDPFMEI